ncbi:Cytochrome c [Phycisphaerae bacterium RAS1]|nr:Cytochrome c [Phycisphaerae bacterium RAS1]
MSAAAAPTSMTPPAAPARLAGLLVEFDEEHNLVEACRRVRDAGFTRWDAHSPFPVHGIDEAVGIRPTRLPLLVFAIGMLGTLTGLGLTTWANASEWFAPQNLPTNLQGYNFLVSGKPYVSLPAFIPVMFELTVLFAAFTAGLGMLALNGLPNFYNAVFRSPRFRRATTDRFFIYVEAADPRFNAHSTATLLSQLGGQVERIEEPTRVEQPPRWLFTVGIVAVTLSLLPLMVIARARVSKSREPKIHIIQDMDNQEKIKAQRASPVFADGRGPRFPVGMTREQPLGTTVARGDAISLKTDAHFFEGRAGGDWATAFPPQITVDEGLLHRGQQRFNIYCAPCHGYDGTGNGTVNNKGNSGERPGWTWVKPLSVNDQTVRDRANGHIFNTITNGIRTMPAYGDQIPEKDRWAIVAYVRALQRSGATTIDDVPADKRSELEKR